MNIVFESLTNATSLGDGAALDLGTVNTGINFVAYVTNSGSNPIAGGGFVFEFSLDGSNWVSLSGGTCPAAGATNQTNLSMTGSFRYARMSLPNFQTNAIISATIVLNG